MLLLNLIHLTVLRDLECNCIRSIWTIDARSIYQFVKINRFLGSAIFRNDIFLLAIFYFLEHGFEHGFEHSFEHSFEHGFEHGFEHSFKHDFEHGFEHELKSEHQSYFHEAFHELQFLYYQFFQGSS